MMATAFEFLQSFRFGVKINGKPAGVVRISGIEVIEERHGNRRPRPVVLEAALKSGGVGGIGLAAFVHKHGRSTVDICEFDRSGVTGRTIRLSGCRFRRYQLEEKDGRTLAENGAGVVIERVTIHPTKIRFGLPRRSTDEG
jgi:hypothetical protein